MNQTNVVQGQRCKTGEAEVHLAVPDGCLISCDDGLWVAGGTARMHYSDGEEELDVGAERQIPVGLVWVCGACIGTEYVGGWLVDDRYGGRISEVSEGGGCRRE